jgi:hypothetical protein
MGGAAIALAILGVAVGVLFRLKVLLPILVLVLLGSIVFSLAYGFSFLETTLTTMAAQGVVQGCYFLGLVVRAIVTARRGAKSPGTHQSLKQGERKRVPS